MDSEKKSGMLVCTLFDLGAGMHGPVFQTKNLHTLWRGVEDMLKGSQVPKSEFLAFVHGEIDIGRVRDAFQPLLEPLVYSADSRAAVALDAVVLMVKEVSGE